VHCDGALYVQKKYDRLKMAYELAQGQIEMLKNELEKYKSDHYSLQVLACNGCAADTGLHAFPN
jgi:hypothetical protein